MHSMIYWIVAFGGGRAQARYKEALESGVVPVNPATPVDKVRGGDKVLLCAAGVGFVGTATVTAVSRLEGRKPIIRLAGAEEFPEPVVYGFPSAGPHPILGFEPKMLSAGLLAISKKGYLHVYDRAWNLSESEKPAGEPTSKLTRAKLRAHTKHRRKLKVPTKTTRHQTPRLRRQHPKPKKHGKNRDRKHRCGTARHEGV